MELSSDAKKNIKKHKSSQVIKKYRAFIDEIRNTNNPTHMGEQKTGRYKNCFGHRLTKSTRVIYKVSYDNSTIHILKIGDHEELYMRDNRP